MIRKYLLSFLFGFIQLPLFSQVSEPDLQDSTKWKVINRTIQPVNENGKKAVSFNEVSGAGLMILKNSDFSNGTIELDIKGSDKPQQSFVGFAFHGQDINIYDAIYFRPFNFKSDDAVRRSHSVQYISMPDYDWEKLRSEFPDKYENKIDPAPNPNDWFHVKINVNGKKVSVYVNNNPQAVLEVEKLNANSKGGFALWAGNNSAGAFANLKITKSDAVAASLQTPVNISYGNNPETGHYLNVGSAKLYYEIYGTGKPLVLLHGGVYGYIDEFEPFIKRLSENYQVICIATRGHGKSEIGNEPFTYKQRAEDAYKVIRSITKDSVIVLGFSDGAFSGLKLAALHPELVSKLISIGAGDRSPNSKHEKFNYNPQSLMKYDSAFFASRLALMPEPSRWKECLTKLNKLYNEDYLSKETFEKIKCPVLVMAGDRDDYSSTEAVVKVAKGIKNAQLSIIPNCHHVVFFCNFPAVWEAIQPFLKYQKNG
ncbi:MAG: alpha/beta hydrolase [Ferruginibacter sp.]